MIKKIRKRVDDWISNFREKQLTVNFSTLCFSVSVSIKIDTELNKFVPFLHWILRGRPWIVSLHDYTENSRNSNQIGNYQIKKKKEFQIKNHRKSFDKFIRLIKFGTHKGKEINNKSRCNQLKEFHQNNSSFLVTKQSTECNISWDTYVLQFLFHLLHFWLIFWWTLFFVCSS